MYDVFQSIFAIEVESLLDFLVGGRLVNADVTNGSEEGEVDVAADILLVVAHELQQTGIVVAGDGHASVVLLDILYGLAQAVSRETGLHVRQVELDHQSVGYGIAVKDGDTLKGHRLEGMSCGMTEVEGFAQSLLVGILRHDALLDGNALGNHRGER